MEDHGGTQEAIGAVGHARFALAALAVVSVGLSIGVIEVAFRIAGVPFSPDNSPAIALAQFDPELGWRYLPDRSATISIGNPVRTYDVHTNDIGARVPAPGTIFDRQAPTILFVGDSFTMGHGVAYEHTFIGRLAGRPRVPYQLVNLGVQAYGTDQSLLMLRRYADSFDVRAMVYVFIANHVMRNAVADYRLVAPRARFSGTKPRFLLGADGRPRLVDLPRLYDSFGYSRVWALLQLLRLHRGPSPSMELTMALVDEMQRIAESQRAKFILVHWDQWDRGRRVWEGEASPFRGRVANLIETARNAPNGWESWTIPGDDHPDERAHAQVARLLEAELRRLDLNGGEPESLTRGDRLGPEMRRRPRLRGR